MPMAQVGKTPNIVVDRVVDKTTGQVPKLNDTITFLALFAQLHFKSRTTTTAPGSPAEGDCYVVPSGSTGYTGCATNDVAAYSNGSWWKQTPQEGWHGWVEDEDIDIRYTGTNWIEKYEVGDVAAALTASTTQTQGQLPLTKVLNQIATCANANDACTLPAARKGRICIVANDGAQTLQVFPASADAIDAGAADASTTIASGKRRVFYALDGTTWVSLLGA